MNAPASTSTSITWPAERFYWAVLDAPMNARASHMARPLPAGLVLLLQDEVPELAQDLFAVGVPLDEHRTLACAARRAELAELASSVLELRPGGLPPSIEAASLAPAAINLLAGEFEPRPLRVRRSRAHLLAMAAALAAAALVHTGLVRRAAHAESLAASAEARTRELLAAGGAAPAPGAELARLRAARAAAKIVQPAPEALPGLLAVLSSWPATAAASVQSLSVTGGVATLSLSVEGDPAPLLKAIKAPAGWSIDEPRINRSADLARVVLVFRPAAPAAHASRAEAKP